MPPAARDVEVVEPGRDRSVRELARHLGEAAVERSGAVLLRGFDVRSPVELEAAIGSVPDFRPMPAYFMVEPGRERVAGTSAVFNTNSILPTGGGFTLPGSGIHSENFYSTDTPRWVVFWCRRAPLVGGETALYDARLAFGSLTADLQAKLLAIGGSTPRAWPIDVVARRYGVTEDVVVEVVDRCGLERRDVRGRQVLVLHKPVIFELPGALGPTLAGNLATELPGFTERLVALHAPSYRSPIWTTHRRAWRRRAGRATDQLGVASTRPSGEADDDATAVVLALAVRRGKLTARLTAADVDELATAIWRHRARVRWRRGDVLVFDNLQFQHGGLPGIGRRELNVMMLNPLPLVGDGSLGLAPTTLHAELVAAAAAAAATASPSGASPR